MNRVTVFATCAGVCLWFATKAIVDADTKSRRAAFVLLTVGTLLFVKHPKLV